MFFLEGGRVKVMKRENGEEKEVIENIICNRLRNNVLYHLIYVSYSTSTPTFNSYNTNKNAKIMLVRIFDSYGNYTNV